MRDEMKKVPRLRFRGFQEDWELCKLKEITERVKGNDGRMDLPTLTISAGQGWLNQKDRFSGNIAGKEQKNYTLLLKNELSYNHGNSKLAKYGAVFSLKTYEEALVPRVYHSFKSTKNSDPDFLEYIFATKKPDKELGKLVSSGARMDGLLNINYDDFSNIKINIPHVHEQKKISNLLRKIDNTITLHQRKLEQLKELKKAYLQLMFVPTNTKNNKVPKLRFANFEGNWEQCKLIDLATTYIGLVTTMTTNYTDQGTLLIRNSDIKEGKFDLNNPIYLKEEFAKQNENRSMKMGDVVTVHTGDIGTSAVITEDLDGTIGFATITTRPSKKLNSNYLCWYFNSNIHKKYAKRMSTGDGRSNYNMKDFNKNILVIPKIEEQQTIGIFFQNLDNTITLHQNKLDQLKSLKKSYLQNMFI
ncbi:restriction endonuclease subunit S [Enterococcus faecalis]|uniref:restriction endonuclease subunit S n=1 Tax=Enterococcus faecalis TaxID=1351 RepID=UPI0001F0D32B|nr:type I restriction modification DNA specificity domain protein [Enterococcus faecalis TX0012]